MSRRQPQRATDRWSARGGAQPRQWRAAGGLTGRPIHLASLDKTRPVLVLTRPVAREVMTKVTVAPITSTVKGLSSEVPVGTRNGLDHDSAVSLDNVMTIPVTRLGRRVGMLLPDQEARLARAMILAYDLDLPLPAKPHGSVA